MARLDQIKAEIEALSFEDLAQLHEWIAEKDWRRWDQRIEGDDAAAKLDFLRGEAVAAKD